MGGVSTSGEDNITLCDNRGPTDSPSGPRLSLAGADHKGMGRPNSVGARPTGLVPNTSPGSENGNIEHAELERTQLVHESHVQESPILPNNFIPLRDRNSELHSMEPSGGGQCQLQSAYTLRGRRPKRSNNHSARGTKAIQCRDGAPSDGTWGTRLRKLHTGQTSSERVQKAFKLNYYCTIFQDDKGPESNTEEWDGPVGDSTSPSLSVGPQ
ncbi:hypothetical protein FXO38_01943 [Capsicum annuum]|nr:hypothetical protein FXO37_29943 [Capsicum annuum]KAF3681036.1 hypothetical protein FXO38_01943 [Capsicum annuum]